MGEKMTARSSLLRQLRLRDACLRDRPPLLKRTFVDCKPASASSSAFTVMQFNALAMGLSSPEVSGFLCDPKVLDWKERRAMILEEIVTRDADLIGMQGWNASLDGRRMFLQRLCFQKSTTFPSSARS